jgi:hypothetical protein
VAIQPHERVYFYPGIGKYLLLVLGLILWKSEEDSLFVLLEKELFSYLLLSFSLIHLLPDTSN